MANLFEDLKSIRCIVFEIIIRSYFQALPEPLQDLRVNHILELCPRANSPEDPKPVRCIVFEIIIRSYFQALPEP